jgi:LuxR family maltose regulon positive regulatory protein
MVSVGPRAGAEEVVTALDTSGPLHARTTVPAPPAGFVGRPRLEAVLADAVSRRLTLISAGPGWGKTTAVAAWARSTSDPVVAWLTLESSDEDPTAFWADVLTALRRAGAVPPGHPLSSISVPSRISSDLVRRLLYAVDLLPQPVALVLDDFHHAGPEVLETVDDLLRYPLPLHLVVLTRLDPLLSLRRLRGQGEVAEVGASDLAFGAEDVSSLGAVHGRTIEAEQIDRLVSETGGWPVGVRLHVEAYDDPTRRARAQRSAAEFLLSEVLERLDPTARRFLLRTSVTPAVSAELAAALDPGAPAARLLPELASTNGFVARFDADGSWFRYHPLLREMLQSQLVLEDPGGSREAHRAAARWFARHGVPLRALEHAVESADWELVGDVFVDVAAAHLIGPRRQAVAEALDRVPYPTVTPTVQLHLCAASSAIVSGRFDAALHQVARARELLTDPSDEPASSVLLELVDASAGRAVGDVRRLARAGASALAAADAVPFPFPALETYRTLAYAYREAGEAWCAVRQRPAEPVGGTRSGDPGSTRTTTDDDLRAAGELVVLGARSARALLDVAAGRFAVGERAARDVVDEASARGWVGHVETRAALAALAWVAMLRAEDERADLLLAQARCAVSGAPEPASETAALLLEALLAAVRGRARATRRAVAQAGASMGQHPIPPMVADLHARVVTEVALLADRADEPRSGLPAVLDACDPAVARVCRARTLLRAGRTGEALQLVEGLADSPDDTVDDLTRVEAALAEASALVRTGTRFADPVVERGLRAAEPGRLVRPFLTVATDELRPVVDRAVTGRSDALAQRLRACLPDLSGGRDVPLVEPLTERERAILATLPTMASNLEIAEELFVSVNTVKAHLKTLYRKLEVGTRRDAVRRGRQLGLLR